jgi:hypothetical protein
MRNLLFFAVPLPGARSLTFAVLNGFPSRSLTRSFQARTTLRDAVRYAGFGMTLFIIYANALPYSTSKRLQAFSA